MTLPKTTNSSALGNKKNTNTNLQTNILMESIREKFSHPEKTTFSTLSVIAHARLWGMGRPGILWNLCFFPLVHARNIKMNPEGGLKY